jgi:hypothetical protein
MVNVSVSDKVDIDVSDKIDSNDPRIFGDIHR